MKLINLSGKHVNIEGLEFNERNFKDFFSKYKPWKDMQTKEREKALKTDYKIYLKSKPEKKTLSDKE